MEEGYIKSLIEREYNIEVNTIEKIKNTYKINGDEGYCLKIIKYEYPHFYFIYSAIDHLIKSGLDTVIPFERTRSGEGYIKIKSNYGYLTKWYKSRCADYLDEEEVKRVTSEVGKLHKASEGFIITPFMKPRVYWMSWIKTFKTRRDEILDFKNRISQKAILNEFDIRYSENIEREIERANRVIENLEKSEYKGIMKNHIMELGFCHHDLANHNVLVNEEGKIKFIDFDYCILDSHIHDLASLIIRVSKVNGWNCDTAKEIVKTYSKERKIEIEEIEVIKEFIRFPQGFWQLGIQAYWEIQPWTLEKFNLRLDKYLNEIEERERFVNNFFSQEVM